jgi:hypothetical protein
MRDRHRFTSIKRLQAASVNTMENFALKLRKELTGIVIDRMDKNEAIAERYLDEAEPEFQEAVFALLLSSIYPKLRDVQHPENGSPSFSVELNR